MPLAGQIVTAQDLDLLQPKYYFAEASANLVRNNTTAVADIVGASITLDTELPDATYKVIGTFDVQIGATGAGNMLGYMQVDGVTDTGQAAKRMDAVTRDTIVQQWEGQLPSAGTHTFKLQGQTSVATVSAGNIFTANSTKISVEIIESV